MASSPHPHPASAPPVAGPARIAVLVAEPHPVMRDALVALLGSDARLAVSASRDWRELARDMTACAPAVVVLNRSFLGGDDRRAVQWLHELGPETAVFLTGMEHEAAYGRSAERAGAVAYLPLDTAPEELVAVILDAALREPAPSA